MIPRVGQKIGPYEILGRLGSGGMGLVFSAWDERLHRDVAIKLLKDEYLNPTMRTRFLGEARAASRLNHPNICTIFDIGEELDSPYMVMELLKGDTLRGRMQKGPLPLDVVTQVATQVADALSVAHEQGIVHRDIKPANVVLVDKPNGAFQTKVLDFGLAKVDLGEYGSRSGLTTTGMTVGTVSYMSPEQARGEVLDGRSDLFSLGILMYEMTTGKLPFDGATSALIFVQLLNHPPESLRSLNTGVPRAFEQVINKCLQKDRDDRYQTGQELVSALHKAALALNSDERTSTWLSKFTLGLKRESSSASQLSEAGETRSELAQESSASLKMTSDEAFLRPFKPGRKSDLTSQHFKPVNAPYSESSKDSIPETNEEEEFVEDEAPNTGEISGDAKQASDEYASTRTSSSEVPALRWTDEPVEAPSHDEFAAEDENTPSTRAPRILFGLLVTVVILVITVAVVLSKRQPKAAVVTPTVFVAAIANHTGDNTLGNVVESGLSLSLEQSPFVSLRRFYSSNDILMSELPAKGDARFEKLRQEARDSGAAAFITAEIHTERSAYSLSLHAFSTASGSPIGDASSTALGHERIPDAIDSLSITLRSLLGENGTSIHQTSLPLNQVATANMEALAAYAVGRRFQAQNHIVEAIPAFEHALSIDGQFVQADLRLAEMYGQQHAEANAAAMANKAAATTNGDQRAKLLASGLQALFATDDLQKAEQTFSELTKRYRNDFEGSTWLATSQRLEGKFSDALASAQRATSAAPNDEHARDEEELALLALDRTDAALQIANQHGGESSSHTSADQLAKFVSGVIPSGSSVSSQDSVEDFPSHITHAQLLDASGQLNAGLNEWRSIVTSSLNVSELAGVAAYALSHAAVDHALLNDCGPALAMTREAMLHNPGLESTFELGMASGLCGDTNGLRNQLSALQSKNPQSFRVAGYYTSDLNALQESKSGAFADALVTLQSADHYDPISFNAFLSAGAYLGQKQPQPATVQLQTMLRHPGAVVLVTPAALPAAQLSLARAFAANGDAGNTVQAYRKLLDMFSQADPDNALLAEARLATTR